MNRSNYNVAGYRNCVTILLIQGKNDLSLHKTFKNPSKLEIYLVIKLNICD